MFIFMPPCFILDIHHNSRVIHKRPICLVVLTKDLFFHNICQLMVCFKSFSNLNGFGEALIREWLTFFVDLKAVTCGVYLAPLSGSDILKGIFSQITKLLHSSVEIRIRWVHSLSFISTIISKYPIWRLLLARYITLVKIVYPRGLVN